MAKIKLDDGKEYELGEVHSSEDFVVVGDVLRFADAVIVRYDGDNEMLVHVIVLTETSKTREIKTEENKEDEDEDEDFNCIICGNPHGADNCEDY